MVKSTNIQEKNKSQVKIKKITLRLDLTKKQEIKKFNFIKEKIKEEKVKKNSIKSYEPLKNTDVIRHCIQEIYNNFINISYQKIKELKELKKSILKDKMELMED